MKDFLFYRIIVNLLHKIILNKYNILTSEKFGEKYRTFWLSLHSYASA